jgi:hypothetical protein
MFFGKHIDHYPYGCIRVFVNVRVGYLFSVQKNAETEVTEMVTCLTLFWMIQR